MPVPSFRSADNHQAPANQPDFNQLMMRELLIWLVGVPVPIAAVIGLFVL